MSTLDNLKKHAKRWLHALRANDPSARARLTRAHPNAPAEPTLRDVQHALARERGVANWKTLTASLGSTTDTSEIAPAIANDPRTPDELAASFLQLACWDHHVHGKGDHRMHDHAAQRVLARHPDLARHSLFTAIICGDIDEVRRRVALRDEAAREAGGSRGWTPLLYLTYARFTHQPLIDNAIGIGRLLLDHGADPNVYYMAGDSRYTPLVGVAGQGEQDSPRQPYAAELYRLLLDRDAGPFDQQVVYNTHFTGEMLWWLEPTYGRTKTTRADAWADPSWEMFDMGGYGTGSRFLLTVAIRKRNVPLARWVLEHGAGPNDPPPSDRRQPKMTLYQYAIVEGCQEIADLLVKHGAIPSTAELTDEQQFGAACFRMDRGAVTAAIARHPKYLKSTSVIFAAAARDRDDVVAMLLDLGVPLEIRDKTNKSILHEAAGQNALKVAALLVASGAEIDPREMRWGGTPIGWAAHADHTQMMDFLSTRSRNVWTLTFRGYVDRMREILRDDASLATSVNDDGTTLLWWLPDDEEQALVLADLLIANGADPSFKTKGGRTAGDWAFELGKFTLAARLGCGGTVRAQIAPGETAPTPADLAKFEALAQDLSVAFQTGEPSAMQRLFDHFGNEVSWERLREIATIQIENIPEHERPKGYFGLPHAQLLIARISGFDNWAALVTALEAKPDSIGQSPGGNISESASVPPPIDRSVPVEMRTPYRMRLYTGETLVTTDVWAMLMAARHGDLDRVRAFVDSNEAYVHCNYNYMPPLHLAAREGHIEIARFLLEHGAADPHYRTYPYGETIETIAADRGFEAIGHLLAEHLAKANPERVVRDNAGIDYGKDVEADRFQKLVDANALAKVEEVLGRRPDLALDETAFWSEGILMMPAKVGNREMVELLMRFGATVPVMTKWCREYYFKRADMAALLLERGMNPNHHNVHRTTLLHNMADAGDIVKATLLLDHGADINAIDDEFRSTPLGLAARWGRHEMVRFLLDRGADRDLAGAPWATPREWSRKKGHLDIAADLG